MSRKTTPRSSASRHATPNQRSTFARPSSRRFPPFAPIGGWVDVKVGFQVLDPFLDEPAQNRHVALDPTTHTKRATEGVENKLGQPYFILSIMTGACFVCYDRYVDGDIPCFRSSPRYTFIQESSTKNCVWAEVFDSHLGYNPPVLSNGPLNGTK